jgi:hypothetical protein
MKIRVSIPVDTTLHGDGEFRIMKQITDEHGKTAWELAGFTSAVSGGEFLADLEPGYYQKVESDVNGILSSGSNFEITADGRYIDQDENVFRIAEDGSLVKLDDKKSNP